MPPGYRGETAAAMVERKIEGQRAYVYFGPRMDAPPADPQEGALLFDEPGVRAYQFGQRPHGLAHFLRATQGTGAMLSVLSTRAPELRHVRRWIGTLFAEQTDELSKPPAGRLVCNHGQWLFVCAVTKGRSLRVSGNRSHRRLARADQPVFPFPL